MAEEHARPGRGRKKDDATDSRSRPASRGRRPSQKAAVTKASAKQATPRTRRPKLVPEPTREAIAEHAYLLWERGEPGGEAEHWLRAEAELRAA